MNLHFERILPHIIQKIPLGLEHFLAMFPATVLVPLIINNAIGVEVIDTSLVLFTSGLGTIIFLVITPFLLKILYKNHFGEITTTIPTYLGSSFAYIGVTIYLLETLKKTDISPHLAYSYVGWSYLFGGIFLMLMSCLFIMPRAKDFFNKYLPAAVMGPAISLIGLDLAESAMQDAGFISNSKVVTDTIYLNGNYPKIVAAITLGTIIFATIFRRRLFKNLTIILGTMVGFLFAWIFSKYFCGNELSISIFQSNWFSIPRFSFLEFKFPPNLLQLFFAIIPATLVVFSENIGRVTVIAQMTDHNNEKAIFSDRNIPKFQTAVFLHGGVFSISAILGSVPNTLYAENIAIMSTYSSDKAEETRYKEYPDSFVKKLHSRFSRTPLFIAASIAIFASFSGHLQQLLITIPTPVLGGIKLFLFGIISAPGIQLLVDQNVNYKKISNQLLTASVLISGVSGLQIPIGDFVTLKGMSLGLFVGIIVNIIVKIFDYFGRLNDTVELDELFQMCIDKIGKNENTSERKLLLKIGNHEYNTTLETIKNLVSEKESSISDGRRKISLETIKRLISELDIVELYEKSNCFLKIEKKDNFLRLYVPRNIFEINEDAKAFLIDNKEQYDHPIEEVENKFVRILFGGSIPWRKIQKYLKNI